MSKTILAISVIALVAIIMVMGSVSLAMAGEQVPPADPPNNTPEDGCDGTDNPSDENASEGKGKARTIVCAD